MSDDDRRTAVHRRLQAREQMVANDGEIYRTLLKLTLLLLGLGLAVSVL